MFTPDRWRYAALGPGEWLAARLKSLSGLSGDSRDEFEVLVEVPHCQPRKFGRGGDDHTRDGWRPVLAMAGQGQLNLATCVELPSLSWLADTQDDALGGLRDLAAAMVQDLTDAGEPAPRPTDGRDAAPC